MKTWKKWLIAVFSIILVAGITLGTIWLVNNWDALTSDTTLYTQEDIDDAYEQGLNDAGYEVILQYQEQIAIIQGQLEESQIKVGNLTDSLNQALAQHEIDQETIAGYLDDITELNNTITDLNNQIKLYQELLEAYENSDKYEVVFYLVQNGEQTPYDAQVVEPNGYLSDVVEPEGNFEGWSLSIGGELIDDLTEIQITEDTNIYGTFYQTVTFMVNDEEYSTQQVGYNKYATEPEEPTVQYYTFEGWTLNGEDVVTVNTYQITQGTTFIAKLTRNELSTFAVKEWNISDFDGSYVWSDGNNIYYSDSSSHYLPDPLTQRNYILNKETGNWDEKVWNGLNVAFLFGDYFWTDGEEVYYSDTSQCVLNKETGNWEEKTWNIDILSAIYVWSDGTNYYYSFGDEQYILNQETGNWDVKIWNGIDSFNGDDVWTDGNKIYISEDDGTNYVLNNETDTWSEQLWNIDNIIVESIWNNGDTVYYSHGTDQYVLNKETGNWDEKIWNGISEFDGYQVWTDGENFYYSNGTQQYAIV